MTHRSFGRTWWGRAWVDALTARARLDPNRLIRGRAYARGHRVRDLAIIPGAIGAFVEGSRPRPYAVVVNVPVFDAAGWTRLLDAMASQIGHLAALLDGELPPGVGAELDLLPGPGQLRSACSCPDTIEPCKHSAAVCYRVADVLDADPFALLLLRGRTRDEILAELYDRRPVDHSPPGMLARHAYRRRLGPLPAVPLPPDLPGRPVPLPATPPAAAGVSIQELTDQATAAARRAWELLHNWKASE